jgi:hypothetical protein
MCRPDPPGLGLEHRASNPVSIKNVNATETSAIKLLRPCVPVRTKRTSSSNNSNLHVMQNVNTTNTETKKEYIPTPSITLIYLINGSL